MEWSANRHRFYLLQKGSLGSELHRPDTEAAQIAEVHLANRILQDEGRVRNGEPIVGADSRFIIRRSFHQAVSLQNQSKILQAAATHTTRVAHPESLQSQVIVHRDLDILLRPEIAFGGLDRRVAEQEFDLLQIPAVLPAQLGARPAEIVGAEVLNPDLLR
jgi:hypothetical protein